MIPIDEKSIKELLKAKPGTRYAVVKLADGMLVHSQWFAFLVEPSLLAFERKDEGVRPMVPAELLPEDVSGWPAVVWPAGVEFKKGMPMMCKDPGEPTETLVQFRTADPKIVSYMKAPVFDWIQATFDDPEFWVRGVDQIVAIKQSGKLIGGVGPACLRVESPVAP